MSDEEWEKIKETARNEQLMAEGFVCVVVIGFGIFILVSIFLGMGK